MKSRHGFSLLILFLLLAVPRIAYGKCTSALIKVSGDVEGMIDGVVLRLEVISSAPQDSRRGVRQEIQWRGNRFELYGWFDTYSGMKGEEHECDRQPQSVTVILARGNIVLASQTLAIAKDFRRTKHGDYELLKPIALRAAASSSR